MFQFIISAPRSGSTWLMNALNHHPQVYATEFRLFGEFCQIWPNNNGTEAPRMTADKFAEGQAMHFQFQSLGLERREFIQAFQTEYFQFLRDFVAKRTDKAVIVDKITPYPGTCELVVRSIRKHFPNAKIVNLVRDGRDVVTSGAFDWLARRDKTLASYRFFVEHEQSLKLKRFFDDQFLAEWSQLWHECNVAIRESRLETLQIRYENMLANQSSELAKICELLGVASSDEICQRCADLVTFEKTTGRQAGELDPMAKVRRGIAGDWRNYFTKEDGRKFSSLASESLLDLGYESDANWMEKLPNQLSLDDA